MKISRTFLFPRTNPILNEEKKKKIFEDVFHESEKRFRIIFDVSPSGIILIDEKGTIIEVNSSFCETLGYSRNELVDKNIRLFSLPDNEKEIEKNIAIILSGKTLKHEVTNLKKDGTTCIVSLDETMIILPDGKPGILSVANDVSERKREQEKTLTLSRALESIGDCLYITDIKNNILFVNNAFCKTYGYSEKELIGKNISIIRSTKNKADILEDLLSETNLLGWNGELIDVRKDGSEFPVELSIYPIKDERGITIAFTGIAVDITERKKVHTELISAKEKAEESDRLKSAFLTNMSHELRTPLNAIIGFSSLMIDSGSDSETITNLKIILNSGQHLLELVEEILDTSMIETEQLKIKYEKVGINSILYDVKNIMHGEKLKENKTEIELILNINPQLSDKFIITDLKKFKQVMINLLKNSLKFTDEGIIEFGYTETEKINSGSLKFYVKDTGIGIDKKYHNVIFDTFRQVDDTHTRKYGGMGIGLSIAKKIVEMLGGEIWVESEQGKGSVFYFTVPELSEIKLNENLRAETSKIADHVFSGKTVLIAEDDVSNYKFLGLLLSKMNIRVLWARDGIEALNICKTEPAINLVLMDIKIPQLNGYEATRGLKEIRPDLPVIAQTAYAMAGDKEEALKAGCDDYISKPVQIKQLIDLLIKYL